jgi:hypothetical protein
VPVSHEVGEKVLPGALSARQQQARGDRTGRRGRRPDRQPHSVLTIHMREDGPTKAAEQRVIAFFKERAGA